MDDLEARFEQLFRDHYRDVWAYAVRRCAARSDAEDVVAETFAVAWRRIGEIPHEPQARLWLFGTARLVRTNQHRASRRRQGLHERLRTRLSASAGRTDEADVAERDRIGRAFSSLNGLDAEILRLHAWEQLTNEEIAISLELSPATARKRLQRARQRFATALDDEQDSSRPTTSFTVPTTQEEVAR